MSQQINNLDKSKLYCNGRKCKIKKECDIWLDEAAQRTAMKIGVFVGSSSKCKKRIKVQEW